MIEATTTAFYKELGAILRKAGYKYTRSVTSALETRCWTHASKPEVNVSGWHGKGKWGTMLICFDMSYSKVQFVFADVMTDFKEDAAATEETLGREFAERYAEAVKKATVMMAAAVK